MGILFTILMGFLLTITLGILLTIVLGIQFTISISEAAASKRRIFDRAAAEKAWVIGQYFPPFPSLGHVIKKGHGWHWQPIETTS